MQTSEILEKIKTLIKTGSTIQHNFLEVKVGDTLIQVDGDEFEVGQTVKIKTSDGFIPAGNSLDGVHQIEEVTITILDSVITEVIETPIEVDTEDDEDTDSDELLVPDMINFESYNDYPNSVKEVAQKVLDWTAENGWGSCGTLVGKKRANMLANGDPLSVETIQRMYGYLTRHKVDLETSKDYETGCGKLMYDAWGGEPALKWSKDKLDSLKLSEMDSKDFKIIDLMDRMEQMESYYSQIKQSIDDYSKKMEEFSEKYNSQIFKFDKILETVPANIEIKNFKTETNNFKSFESLDPLESIRNIRTKK